MSARELAEWARFEEDFGPLTLHERLDAMAGHIAYTVHATAGGSGRMSDFMPQWRSRRRSGDIIDWLAAVATKER